MSSRIAIAHYLDPYTSVNPKKPRRAHFTTFPAGSLATLGRSYLIFSDQVSAQFKTCANRSWGKIDTVSSHIQHACTTVLYPRFMFAVHRRSVCFRKSPAWNLSRQQNQHCLRNLHCGHVSCGHHTCVCNMAGGPPDETIWAACEVLLINLSFDNKAPLAP